MSMNKNADEEFFEQFHEAPRAEFVTGVYKRINQPMNVQAKPISIHQKALSLAVACFLMITTLLIYPPTRVQAFNFLRQIGVLTVTTTDEPDTLAPTALPPDPAQKPVTASSAAEASELTGFQVLAPAWLPDGYSAEGGIGILPNGKGKIVGAGFANTAAGTFILIDQYRSGTGDSFADYVSGNETVQDIQVRGHEGVWITGRLMTNPTIAEQQGEKALRGSNWLIWEENGIVYTIISDGLDQDAMLKLAESLQ